MCCLGGSKRICRKCHYFGSSYRVETYYFISSYFHCLYTFMLKSMLWTRKTYMQSSWRVRRILSFLLKHQTKDKGKSFHCTDKCAWSRNEDACFIKGKNKYNVFPFYRDGGARSEMLQKTSLSSSPFIFSSENLYLFYYLSFYYRHKRSHLAVNAPGFICLCLY